MIGVSTQQSDPLTKGTSGASVAQLHVRIGGL
jgi:hypothetical protein